METPIVNTSDFIHPVKETWRKHKKLIIILLCLKLVFVLLTGELQEVLRSVSQGNWKEQLNRCLLVNNDELLIGEVANNYNNGLGFVSSNEIKRKNYPYDFTAFRPSYPVYLHIGLMQMYQAVFPDRHIVIDKESPYFRMYAALLLVVAFLFFILSLFYFRAITLLFLEEKFALAALILYVLYPSVLIYVGGLPNYESITMSMLIIVFYLAVRAIHHPLKYAELAGVIVLIMLSSLFRPQMNFIFLFLFGIFFLHVFFNRKVNRSAFRQGILLCLAIPLFLITLNIPVLIKNHRLFGAYVLTTAGINISFGHNPYARGSWCGNCMSDPQTPYYKYIRNEIRNYDELNEYEKSHELEKLSYKWIRENPAAELKLAIKKVAIYFIPRNNDVNRINLINLLVHCGALLYCCRLFYLALKRKYPMKYEWMLIAPLAGSLTMCIIFHVGYRWRYYAEPFMVIYAVLFFQSIIRKWFPLKENGIQPGRVI